MIASALAVIALAIAACDTGAPAAATPSITPGTAGAPREVNVVARDYVFSPPIVDLVPGETVVLHVVNGGLEVHEAVIGGTEVQDAWEAAEAAAPAHPPGATPDVSVAPGVSGVRIVVSSGQRRDLAWTVPIDAAGSWSVGCHIPGHFAQGMVVPIRFVQAGLLGSGGPASG